MATAALSTAEALDADCASIEERLDARARDRAAFVTAAIERVEGLPLRAHELLDEESAATPRDCWDAARQELTTLGPLTALMAPRDDELRPESPRPVSTTVTRRRRLALPSFW